MNDRHVPTLPAARAQVDLVLPAGARLGPFEVQRLIARGTSSFVYLATDHALAMPVAIQEYLPMRMVYRDAWLHLHANDAWHEEVLTRGMRTFIEESRLLARCEHPALVRVNHLFEANGTAYRVMPFHPGQRLSEVRAAMGEAPAEGPLRELLEPLLGALDAIHRLDRVHGGVSAANILLIDGDYPLLLSPGAAADEIRSDLVESLMATVESQPGALLPEPDPTGPSMDLRGLAEVMRFCITGDASPASKPREPLAAVLAAQADGPSRPVYSPEFIGTLDAATSSSPEDWPTSVAQFRLWLAHGTPAARASAPRRALAPVAEALSAQVPDRAPFEPQASATTTHPDAVALGGFADDPAGEPFFMPIEPTSIGTPRLPVSPAVSMFSEEAPLSRPTPANNRWRGLPSKLLFGGVLAGLAVGIIAWASGAWNLVPAIPLERDTAAPVARFDVPKPSTPGPVQAPPDTASPNQPVETAKALPVESAAPTPGPTTPSAETAPAVPTTVAPTATTEPTLDPQRVIAAQPPGAGAKPRRAVAHPPARPRAAATRQPADPRSACAGRTEFALYRCMKQQCQAVKWSANPQCVRLRLDDKVE